VGRYAESPQGRCGCESDSPGGSSSDVILYHCHRAVK
jgi:hypothetical protein